MKPYPAYKDSGVEWIGEAPEGWEVTKVKFLSTTPVQYGLNIGAENYAQGGVRFIRTTDVDDYGNLMEEGVYLPEHLVQKEYRLSEGDFLISRSGTVGRAYVHLSRENQFSYAGYLVRFTFKDSSIAKFLFYFTKSDIFSTWLEGIGIESTIINVNGQKYANLSIALPTDRAEQTTIAAYLDRMTAQIDTLIEQKRRLITLLQEERTAVISQAVTKGLAGLKADWSSLEDCSNLPSGYKDSGVEWIGAVPAGWEVVRLKWVIRDKLKYGANESTELSDTSLPRYIRITDFDEGGNLREETFKSLEWEIAKEYLLEEGDILFARSGATVGKTFQFKNYDGVACFAGYLIKASPNEMLLGSDFLYYYTKSSVYENWKNSIFIQATIQNIGADKYQNLEVPLPSLSDQTTIAAYLDQKTTQIDQTIARTERQIELLQEYRTALISAAVTGKIDVREEVWESQS